MTQSIQDPFTKAQAPLLIQEVGPRDGFQIEAAFIPTVDKIALIDALSLCGLAKIEATSFTSPKAIPALADADEVLRGIRRQPGVVYTVLVPNLRGAERALAAGADELNLVMSTSETHNLLNLRMSREQVGATMEAARRAGMNPGDYVGNLVANVPVLSAGGSRAEHIAKLIASSAELSTLSRNIHRLTALLRQANVEPARQYREMLDTLAGEVREHLVVASCVLASLRPRREIAMASEQGDRERPASRPLSRRPPAHTRQVLTDEPE